MSQRIALITGASRGLGAALAFELASRGWHIVAVARTVGALEELDDRIQAQKSPGQGDLTLAPMNVTDDDAMRHLCLSIHQRWGHLDLWAHTAIHAAPLAPVGHLDAKDWEKSIATNVRATGILIPMIEPLLRAAAPTGTAMFFDDPRAGAKFFGAYGASKAAQIALASSWAAEGVNIGPRVLITAPAPMPTATRARFFPGEDRTLLTAPEDEACRLIGLI
jgi:hypothetical protein